MSFPPTIIDLPADYWTARLGHPIVAIIAHGTAGTDSRNTLQHGGGRRVSVHRLLPKGGAIYRMVADDRGANHAGFGTLSLNGKTYSPDGISVNVVTLGFELENLQNGKDPYPEVQLLAMGWQINDWRRLHGPLPIFRHADIDPTRRSDPLGLSVAEIERWTKEAARRLIPPLRHFVVRLATPIYTSREHPDTVALDGRAQLAPGDPLIADDVTSAWAHRADGLGFVPLGALMEAP